MTDQCRKLLLNSPRIARIEHKGYRWWTHQSPVRFYHLNQRQITRQLVSELIFVTTDPDRIQRGRATICVRIREINILSMKGILINISIAYSAIDRSIKLDWRNRYKISNGTGWISRSKLYDYFLKINNLNKILIHNFILLRYLIRLKFIKKKMKWS